MYPGSTVCKVKKLNVLPRVDAAWWLALQDLHMFTTNKYLPYTLTNLVLVWSGRKQDLKNDFL